MAYIESKLPRELNIETMSELGCFSYDEENKDPKHSKIVYIKLKPTEEIMSLTDLVIQTMIDFKVITRDELKSLLHVVRNIDA